MNVFLGVVEDNSSDPLKMGRCKVRVVGVHTDIRLGEEDGKGIGTANLPWASPLSSESIDGQSTLKVPAQGSVVMIVFLDEDQQVPIYLGTLPKIADIIPDFTQGFSDPAKQHPSADYKAESPISRLARNENIDKTFVPAKNGSRTQTPLFNEPAGPYAAQYPHNSVIETASGHVIEIDDTPGAERIHIRHTSGTFLEMHPDGQMVTKIQGTNTTIVIDDNNISVGGAHNLVVSGDTNVECSGTVNINAASNINLDGGSGGLQGVVTGSHICHYTGKPHGSKSGTVKASI
jgi:hypothetical protein